MSRSFLIRRSRTTTTIAAAHIFKLVLSKIGFLRDELAATISGERPMELALPYTGPRNTARENALLPVITDGET